MEHSAARNRRLLWMGIVSLLSAGAVTAVEPALSLTTELDELRTLQTRLLLDGSAFRFLYLERRAPERYGARAELQIVGFSCPWLTFGPVLLEGMIAQLYNPLGHAPGSEVFSQTADISLDIGLDTSGSGRRAVLVEILPDRLGLIVLRREDFGVQAGGTLLIPFGDTGRIGLLFLLSDPPGGSIRADRPWFADTPVWPGGPVSNVGGSLYWAREPTAVHLVVGASGAQWLPPGFFSTLHGTWHVSTLELAALLAACADGFITPEGRYGELKYRLGLRLVWEPAPTFSMTAACGREISRPALQPGLFLESEDRLAVTLSASRPIIARRSLTLQAGAAGCFRYHCDGGTERELGLDCGALLSGRRCEVPCKLSEKRKSSDQWQGGLQLSCALRPAGGRVELELELDLHPRPGWQLGLDLELNNAEKSGQRRRFYTRVEMKEALSFPPSGLPADPLDLLSFGLGWEVRVPAPRIPAQVRCSSSLATSK